MSAGLPKKGKTPLVTGPRADSHLSGLAGEFFVAAELLRRGYLVAVTMGNAKSVDLFAKNTKTGKSVSVQVKTLRKKNAWPIKPASIDTECIYVFVILNEPDKRPDYYIIAGIELKARPKDFWPRPDEKMPGFRPVHVLAHQDAWKVFDKTTI